MGGAAQTGLKKNGRVPCPPLPPAPEALPSTLKPGAGSNEKVHKVSAKCALGPCHPAGPTAWRSRLPAMWPYVRVLRLSSLLLSCLHSGSSPSWSESHLHLGLRPSGP